MPHRILIADDEPNIVASLEFLMRRCDYEVCERATATRRCSSPKPSGPIWCCSM